MNYQKKIKRTCKTTPDAIMEKMIKHYQTNIANLTCKCGEAKLLSAMLETQLPCYHLVYMGATFPEIDPPELNIINSSGGEFIIEYNYIKSEKVELNDDYFAKIKKYACKIIKRYSYHQKK